MKVLIGCEYSARVRDAFRALGHDAWSCDPYVDCEGDPAFHLKCDVLDLLDQDWDLMVAHPPCTVLTLAGIRWLYHPDDTELPAAERRRHPKYPNRMDDVKNAADFFNRLKNSSIPKIAIENSQPHGIATSLVGKYTQKVQPWMFGDPFTKGACLWLKGLPLLVPTNITQERAPACHMASPGPDRWKERSRTHRGIAAAMAMQWGGVPSENISGLKYP